MRSLMMMMMMMMMMMRRDATLIELITRFHRRSYTVTGMTSGD